MAQFFFWFVLVWFVSGAASIPISWITRKIMHSPLPIASDIVKDKDGNKKQVNYGYKVLVYEVGLGLFPFWIACGALAAALYEYSNGTNFPKKHKLNYWNGDLVIFNRLGPIMLLWYTPVALITAVHNFFKG